MISKIEFEHSLQSPIQFWGKLGAEDVKGLLGCEAAQMVQYDQNNPHHCYDLFQHTLHTVKNLGDSAPTALKVAAFFHDIGKPHVAIQKRDRTVFYGHAKKSVEIAKPILYQLGYSQREVERICFFIVHHDDFISWVLPSQPHDRSNPYRLEISPANLQSHIVKTMKGDSCFEKHEIRELWHELLLLCRADSLSQADNVFRGGVVIDSKANKLKKIDALQTALAAVPII